MLDSPPFPIITELYTLTVDSSTAFVSPAAKPYEPPDQFPDIVQLYTFKLVADYVVDELDKL